MYQLCNFFNRPRCRRDVRARQLAKAQAHEVRLDVSQRTLLHEGSLRERALSVRPRSPQCRDAQSVWTLAARLPGLCLLSLHARRQVSFLQLLFCFAAIAHRIAVHGLPFPSFFFFFSSLDTPILTFHWYFSAWSQQQQPLSIYGHCQVRIARSRFV